VKSLIRYIKINYALSFINI